MNEKQSEITEALATKLEAGTLTVEEFRRGIDALLPQDGEKRQDILYLQSNNTSLQGEVIGMTMIEDGELSEGPLDPKDWPYKTVLKAVCAGWRIISFPNMALLAVSESDPHGLGFEFILERIKD
tara:strand:- start:97 stop:471 length:375 start_codon:yes stop_codon:yes gene_type:complete